MSPYTSIAAKRGAKTLQKPHANLNRTLRALKIAASPLTKAFFAATTDDLTESLPNLLTSFGATASDVNIGVTALREAMRRLKPHWKEASRALSMHVPTIAVKAAKGIFPHIPKLIAAEKTGKLRFLMGLPSAPGTHGTNRVIPIGKKHGLEVEPTGGRLFGFTFQRNRNQPDTRQPLFRVDYWDVRPSFRGIHLHYHVPPRMKDHNPIWRP